MIDDSAKIIYSDIKQELGLLLNMIPDNENLLKLDRATDYFKNDKEGLLIIRHGLNKINKSINEIKIDGQSNFTSVIKKILTSIKYD